MLLLRFKFGHQCFENAGYPLPTSKKIPCQGIHREFGIFAKTQGIWFALVVNSLILKVKDISIFVAKISPKFLKLDQSAKSVLCML